MADTTDAFITFYETDHPRVLRSVTLILGDPARSERITQEAFVRTHSAWRRVQGERAFHYAMRCAFRLAWRARPAEEGDHVLEDDPIDRLVAPTTATPRAMGGPGAVGDDRLDVAIDLRDDPSARDSDLELALSALPRAQRSVIVFWYYLGFDEPAIAEVMSIRESQVAIHLERARARLMALLGEDRSGVA